MVDIETIGVEFKTDGLKAGQRELDKTTQAANKTADAADKVSNKAGGLSSSMEAAATSARLLAGAAVAVATSMTLMNIVRVQREFDVMNASLVTVTGSSAKAKVEFAWLKDFASTTPYGLNEVTQGFVKMKALGLDPGRAALTSYGNTASAMGKSLNQMIEAVADAATGEFERLKEFGIKAKQQGDQVSLTFQGVTKTIGNNAAEITQYLQAIGNNEFAGAMAERAKTLDGLLSNLADTWDELYRTVSSADVGTFIFDSVTLANNAVSDAITILNALKGATGESARETGVLKGAQESLAVIFETIAVLGLNVKYVMEAIGREIGGVGAQLAALARLDLAAFSAIGAEMRADAEAARRDVDATTQRILNARRLLEIAKSGEGQDEPRFARLLNATNAQTAATDKGTKANKKSADTMKELQARRDTFTAGVIDSMMATEMASIDQYLWNKSMEEGKERLDKLVGAEQRRSQALEDDVEKQKAANQLIGLSRTQVALMEAARLREAAAIKEQTAALNEQMGDYSSLNALYRKQAASLRELADERVAGAFSEEMDTQRKNDLAEWNRYWDQIGASLTDALMEGGKSGAEYLKGLFRTLVLRPVILSTVQGGMSALGLGPQSSMAGTASSLSAIGNAGSFLGGVSSFGSGFMSGVSETMLGSSFVGPSASAAAGSTGLGASLGAAAPWLLGGLAIASFLKGFDDSGTLHMGGAGAFGASLGAVSGAASQDYTGFGLTSDQYTSAANKQATDIAKSLVGILDTTAAAFGSSGRYTVGTGFADDSSKDGAWGALRISKDGQIVSDWGMGADKWPGRTFSDGEAGRTEYLSAVASEIRTALKAETPAWAGVMMDALGDTPTIEDLSAVVQQINAFQKALHGLGVAMPQLAGLADDTVTALVNAFGGTEALASSVSAYYQTFYSASEQFSTSQRLLGEQFAALNIKVPESTSSFRALVDSQDLTTEAGRSTYASLMQLAPAFYTVAKAVEDTFNAISSTTAQSVRDIEMSILGDAEKYQYLDREIEGLITKLSTATLPADIQATFEKINQGTMAAYNLLGADQQKALATQFIDRLYEAEAIAQSRLSVSGQQATTQDAQAQAVLENKAAAADSRAAAKEMLDAATVYRQAAENMLAASNKATVVELRLNGQRVAANEVEFG